LRFDTIASVLLLLPIAVVAVACGGTAPAPELSLDAPKTQSGAAGNGEVIAEYRESVHSDLPVFQFTLRGTKPSADSAPARIRTIVVRRDGESDPIQVIAAVDADAPLDRAGAFEVLDMNFDGYRDMRLMEFQPAGPNVPYRNWTFDQTSGRFEPVPELDRITSPVFDPDTKTIRSAWRDGAAHYGEDTYAYIAGKPVLVRREERLYTGPGVYTRTLSERRGGELAVVESTQVRE
jgi:hypothetical protein